MTGNTPRVRLCGFTKGVTPPGWSCRLPHGHDGDHVTAEMEEPSEAFKQAVRDAFDERKRDG